MMTKIEETISEIIKKRKYHSIIVQGYIQSFIKIIILLLIGIVLLSQVFLIVQNKGISMFPSIKDGDLLLAYRLTDNYSKDDIVVYQQEDSRHIGRIVATENDIVTIDDNGNFLVNGTVQSGEILFLTYAKDSIVYPYTVPENCVFILGDYRTEAEDSRDYGAVSTDALEGKVILLLRRRGL